MCLVSFNSYLTLFVKLFSFAFIFQYYSNSNQYNEKCYRRTKFIDTNFNTIRQFDRSSLDEFASIVIATVAGIFLSFDISGVKLVIPDHEWNNQTLGLDCLYSS